MKYLIPVVIFFTAILYIPFHLDRVQEKNENGNSISRKMQHIVEFDKDLDEISINDIVVFNTKPPHFAKVGKQDIGVQRSLYVLKDSIVKSNIGPYWAKKYFWNSENLDWINSDRTIDPDIQSMFDNGEISRVFRNIPSRFSYSSEVGLSLIHI